VLRLETAEFDEVVEEQLADAFEVTGSHELKMPRRPQVGVASAHTIDSIQNPPLRVRKTGPDPIWQHLSEQVFQVASPA
jgi:hypothetical protein